jgi:transposase
MDKLIIGIDIGKSFHQATAINQEGQIIGGSIRFANTTAGAKLLLSRISSVNKDQSLLVFGLEATGHYWLSLFSFLSDLGHSVVVINPYQSDAWRKVYLSSTKTDQEDSYLIAEILRFGKYQATKLASEDMIALRNLSRFRLVLNQQLTDTKRRIITILDQVFPEFEGMFSDIFGKTARVLLKEYSTPEAIDSLSTRKLTSIVTKLSKGHFKEPKALEIKEKAANSFGIKLALDSLTLQLELLLKQLEFSESQLKIVDVQINPLIADDCVLLTLPGVSKTIAASILSEIGDINRFKTSSQLVSFAGINPTVRQSGNFLGNKNHMSKKGTGFLRLALWQASVTSVRFNPVLKDYYNQKLSEGKNHMTVIGAVSRKLAGIIFAMLRDNKQFKPEA